ncbi:MAG: hypothetical protein KJZ96_15670 [Rhodocyclaceae bacterium]|nr:hypothetical protein [Rhodocyclaceae bacterium]
MIIIRPATLDDAAFVASSVPEDDHPEYEPVATYAKGDHCIVAAAHLVFESLEDGNVGNEPATNPTKWLKIGHTNRWKMLRDPIAEQTSTADEIEIKLLPGLIDALALFNLDATSVEISLDDPIEGVVWSRTVDLQDDSSVTDWYSYFFEPIVRKRDFNVFDMPPYAGAELTVKIINTGAVAKCGLLVAGQQYRIGGTEYGAQFGLLEFSRVDRDEFGAAVIVPRRSSKRAACQIWVDNALVGHVYKLLAGYGKTPLVWSAANGIYEDVALVYGYYRDFTVTVQYPKHSVCLLEIEGLT